MVIGIINIIYQIEERWGFQWGRSNRKKSSCGVPNREQTLLFGIYAYVEFQINPDKGEGE